MAKKPEDGRNETGQFLPGNLFSQGLENSGCPPMYSDFNAMAQKIAEYLDYEDKVKKTGKGKGTYTIEGCCLFLGFASRQSMYDYEKKSAEFAYVVSRFKLFLTHWNVQKLYWGGTYMGSQFWLRNHGGYTDESVVNQNQTVTQVTVQTVESVIPLSGNESEVKV